MLYCDPDADIGSRLPSGHRFNADALVDFATRASRRVQSSIGEYFPFPDYNAESIQTPEIVREATWMYGLYLALLELGIDNYLDEEGATDKLRSRSLATCHELKVDESHVDSPEVTGEVLDFGGGVLKDGDGETISGYEDAHALAWRDVYVFAESARISGFRNNVDFEVKRSEDFDAWLLWRLNSTIGADGETVRYKFSWKKRTQIDSAPAGRGVRLVRA